MPPLSPRSPPLTKGTQKSAIILAGFHVSLRNTIAREPIVALETKCFKNKRIEMCSITDVI